MILEEPSYTLSDFPLDEDRHFTVEEYLAHEQDRPQRHEYLSGGVRAMAGATESHERIALEIARLLATHLKGKTCRVFKGDLKLKIKVRTGEVRDVFYYPDVMVVCDPSDRDAYFKTKPRLIIEVMSRDKGRDLIEKLAVYKQVESLEEYFVVSQNLDQPEVYIYRRRNDFTPEILQEGAFTFESVGLSTSVAEVYDC